MKISIVGIGRVGQAIAFAAVAKELADDLVLVGREVNSALGDALDLRQASCFSHPSKVRSGVIADTADSDVVIVSVAIKSDAFKDRYQNLHGNVALFKNLIPPLAALNPNAVFLIVSNPVDVLTQWAQDLSGLPYSQVIGSGTLIDTARLRALLAQRCGVHPLDLRIYVLGEHGDHQVAVTSSASAGGAPLGFDDQELNRLVAEARDGGNAVARAKGYTSHAVALATMMIVEAVAKDSHAVLPVSTRLHNYCGIYDVCLSVPAIIGRRGIVRTLAVEMSASETASFHASAAIVQAMWLKSN